MKKKILNMVLALALTMAGLMGTGFSSSASTQTTGWDVTYDGKGITSSYDVSKSTITSVMPGDTVIFNVDYKNTSDKSADFYLSTDIINSLEEKNIDGSAANISGGAYSYELSYTLNGTTTIIYNSETLGGDNTTVLGLNQIQGTLKNGEGTYFDVGIVPAGGMGTVKIEIALDGNSQDNSYMEKLASLDVRFGVENVEPATTNTVTENKSRTVVYEVPGGTEVILIDEGVVPTSANPQTGDSPLPIIICSAMMLLGIGLILWYFLLTKNKREKVA
ncbi:hypothetical protein [Pseudobutyrivibrio sp.]|uniref:hypothetical protein n=1 Tax=Pseudobutyrivibrio sp. TaxID=2014367 RepID=UPI001D63D6C4|nr:hypothetical protein [Pseudobutyrivibrio sp.]MBE5911508.1 hypothetical protein [Pseudobutyrivibrio sp.]